MAHLILFIFDLFAWFLSKSQMKIFIWFVHRSLHSNYLENKIIVISAC